MGTNIPESNDSSHTAHLIFPTASLPITKTLSNISKSNLSLTNRLHSINADADYVAEVSSQLNLPLIANERCGSWYVPPDLKVGSAYFKSTDGHFGQWGFSLRRLNLQVLECVGRAGVGVVVDSTRRGKHLPDALSKTIPIWIAVFNTLLFPDRLECHETSLSPYLISSSERAQIAARLPHCIAEAQKLGLDLTMLRSQTKRPLRPFWIARGLGLFPPSVDELRRLREECTPILLLMASLHHDQGADEAYVQGAGDDVENWSAGFTPDLFWANRQQLLTTGEDDLPELIAMLGDQPRPTGKDSGSFVRIPHAPWLEIGSSIAISEVGGYETVTMCMGPLPNGTAACMRSHVCSFPCREGKLGSKDLRKILPKILELVKTRLSPSEYLRICCADGKDLAVGVALAVLCLKTNENGLLLAGFQSASDISKTTVRRKLSWITTSMPSASPSRATLNAVNEVLMDPRSVG